MANRDADGPDGGRAEIVLLWVGLVGAAVAVGGYAIGGRTWLAQQIRRRLGGLFFQQARRVDTSGDGHRRVPFLESVVRDHSKDPAVAVATPGDTLTALPIHHFAGRHCHLGDCAGCMPTSEDMFFPVRQCGAGRKPAPNSELRVVDIVTGHPGLFGFEEGYMPQINRHLGELLDEPV